VVPDVDIEIAKDMVDNRNYRVRFDKAENTLGFKCKNHILDEIAKIRNYIINNKGININDSRFSNYKTFISTEVS